MQYFVPVSSCGDLSRLTDTLETVVSEQRILGQIVPSSYMEMERLIVAERSVQSKDSIPVKTWVLFRELAKRAKIESDDELKRCAELLRNIGTLVWFDDSYAGLSDIVITDSQFLTRLFATMVTTKQNYIKDGVLDHSNLVHVWKDPDFPQALHPQLLALLEKFEISYRIDQKIARRLASSSLAPSKLSDVEAFGSPSASSIVPSLLPNQRPTMELLWKGFDGAPGHFIRIYEMLFMPKGLFSRFLVRLLHYSQHVITFWRSGIIAAAQDSLFLVEAIESRRWVMISVRDGANPEQRFREIVEILDSLIFATQQTGDTKRLIPCPHCLAQIYAQGGNFVNTAASPEESLKSASALSNDGLKSSPSRWKGHISSETIVAERTTSAATAKLKGTNDPAKIAFRESVLHRASSIGGPIKPDKNRLPFFFTFRHVIRLFVSFVFRRSNHSNPLAVSASESPFRETGSSNARREDNLYALIQLPQT